MKTSYLLCFFAVLFTACNENKEEKMKTEMYVKAESIQAPVAIKHDTLLEKHGDKRLDPYYWMKLTDDQKNAKEPDQQTKDVLAYLDAENVYRDTMMAHTKDFQEKLYNEIVGRIKQTDMSVPYKYNGYYQSEEKGKSRRSRRDHD